MKIHLKKVFISLMVIFGFAFYAVYQRFGDGFQKFFDNLQNRQVAAETYSVLNTSSTKNQTSANPPLNATDSAQVAYPETIESSQANQTDTTTGTESKNSSLYRDGQYDGRPADAYYGYVQVRAFIKTGKLVDVQFLSYPDDRSYSVEINTCAMPILASEAIKNQCAQVDIVSGATNTSNAFIDSLDSALIQAKTSVGSVSDISSLYKTVDITSGATASSAHISMIDFLSSQGSSVDIVSGATNTGSASTDNSGIQNQGSSVDIVSGATNTGSASTDNSGIQNQDSSVDIVSGATNTGSGDGGDWDNSADDSDEDDDDEDEEDEDDDEDDEDEDDDDD